MTLCRLGGTLFQLSYQGSSEGRGSWRDVGYFVLQIAAANVKRFMKYKGLLIVKGSLSGLESI